MAISKKEYSFIESIFNELKMQKYVINDDGTVAANGNVYVLRAFRGRLTSF